MRLSRLRHLTSASLLGASLFYWGGAADPLSAATFIVGPGGAPCTHATLAAAVAAAQANGPGDDTIRLAVPSLTLAATLDINDHGVLILGGYTSCSAATAMSTTTITGGGVTDGIWLHGAATDYRSFVLSRVDLDMQASGRRALRIEGLFAAVVQRSAVHGGRATNGANLYISGAAQVFVTDFADIRDGVATGNGGGIYCAGGASVDLQSGAWLRDNQASGSGGGLYADDCSFQATSGAPTGERIEIRDNVAASQGGAIAAVNGSSVILSGRWSAFNNTVYFHQNNAGVVGGALYLLDSTATLRNVWLETNSAQTGGGLFVSLFSTLTMDVNEATCSQPRNCSRMRFNYISNQPGSGGGSAIAVAGGGTATIRQTRIYDQGSFSGSPGPAGATLGSAATLSFEGCEFFRNGAFGPGDPEVSRFFVKSGSTLNIAYSTIVDPVVTAGIGAIKSEAGATVRLLSSIVLTGQTFETGSGASASSIFDCDIVSESGSLPSAGTFVLAYPFPELLFTDALNDDYSLLPTSLAIDYCDDFNATPSDTDVDSQVRGFNAPLADNIGTYDLGADEWMEAGALFWDGFETGNTSRWSAVAP